MQNNLIWKKRLFSKCYNIYSNTQLVGKLEEQSFSQTAIGELNGVKYKFKTKGFFSQNTEIIDQNNRKVIGQINYSNWKTKANISGFGKSIKWKYDNVWNTKWSIFDSEGNKINYVGSSRRGHIETNTEDALLVLSGLFVTNYYWQKSIAVIIVIFLPIWLTIFN